MVGNACDAVAAHSDEFEDAFFLIHFVPIGLKWIARIVLEMSVEGRNSRRYGPEEMTVALILPEKRKIDVAKRE